MHGCPPVLSARFQLRTAWTWSQRSTLQRGMLSSNCRMSISFANRSAATHRDSIATCSVTCGNPKALTHTHAYTGNHPETMSCPRPRSLRLEKAPLQPLGKALLRQHASERDFAHAER